MQKIVPRCLVRIFHNELSRSTPLDPNLMFWCVSSCLGAFGTVLLLHETCYKTRQTGAINAKSSCHVLLEFFTTNAPDPCQWTLNSCFGVFLPVWVHFEPFRYSTKLEAKRDKLMQLMQKFMLRCLFKIFHNERSRSTPLELNSCICAFLSVRMHLGLFCYYTKLAAKRAKLVQLMQKFVPRCFVRIFRNEHSRSTPLEPKLMFFCVSVHLGAFGTVSLLHETRCKTGQLVQLMQKFVRQSLVRISRNIRS